MKIRRQEKYGFLYPVVIYDELWLRQVVYCKVLETLFSVYLTVGLLANVSYSGNHIKTSGAMLYVVAFTAIFAQAVWVNLLLSHMYIYAEDWARAEADAVKFDGIVLSGGGGTANAMSGSDREDVSLLQRQHHHNDVASFWQRCIDGSGRIFYANHVTGQSQWSMPDDFPKPLRCKAKKGRSKRGKKKQTKRHDEDSTFKSPRKMVSPPIHTYHQTARDARDDTDTGDVGGDEIETVGPWGSTDEFAWLTTPPNPGHSAVRSVPHVPALNLHFESHHQHLPWSEPAVLSPFEASFSSPSRLPVPPSYGMSLSSSSSQVPLHALHAEGMWGADWQASPQGRSPHPFAEIELDALVPGFSMQPGIFDSKWIHTPTVYSFECHVQRNPSIQDLEDHLTARRFHVLASGHTHDHGSKVYCCAKAAAAAAYHFSDTGNSEDIFLAEFVLHNTAFKMDPYRQARPDEEHSMHLRATFKCEGGQDKLAMFVKQLSLRTILGDFYQTKSFV
jgi:hypothetical protein